MNENQIADIWMLFKEYVDKKTQDAVAERYVELLADYGISDSVFEGASGTDDVLDDAINYYLEETSEEEEGFEEDNWDSEDSDE
jgi:hypothetical protein